MIEKVKEELREMLVAKYGDIALQIKDKTINHLATSLVHKQQNLQLISELDSVITKMYHSAFIKPNVFMMIEAIWERERKKT